MGAYSPDAQNMGGFFDGQHPQMAMRHPSWAAGNEMFFVLQSFICKRPFGAKL